jgi:hypothetical protein
MKKWGNTTSFATAKERNEALNILLKEGKGAWECIVLNRYSIIDIFEDKSSPMRNHVMDWLRKVKSLRPGNGAICFTCNFEFNSQIPPYGVMILRPFAVERPTVMIFSGFCRDCMMHDDMKARVIAELSRQNLRGVEVDPQAKPQ